MVGYSTPHSRIRKLLNDAGNLGVRDRALGYPCVHPHHEMNGVFHHSAPRSVLEEFTLRRKIRVKMIEVLLAPTASNNTPPILCSNKISTPPPPITYHNIDLG